MMTTGWPMWLLLGLGTLGFWGAVAYVAGSIFGRTDPPSPDVVEPLADLDDQLARGEISIEDYRRQRRLLVDGH